MAIQTSADDIERVHLHPMTLAWALKRTAIAFLILTVSLGSLAWLTYASIDPALESEAQSVDQPAAPVTRVNLSL